METWELIKALVISGALGALVGLERQWDKRHELPGLEVFSGLRTFTLFGLFGSLAAFIAHRYFPAFFCLAFMVLAAFLAIHVVLDSLKSKAHGMTTETVALFTFLIGGLVFWRHLKVAVALTISLIFLLSRKKAIHRTIEKLTPEDIRSALQFAVITGVVLPLLPDKDYGWFGAFNPFNVWLMVVLVAGLGFIGYVMVRLMGAQAGIGVMGLVGGLASSTASTLAFSRKSREEPALSAAFSLAVVLACTVMLGRVAVLVFTVNEDLFRLVWYALLILALPGLLLVAWHFLWGKSHSTKVDRPRLSNPLDLGLAVKFAALYALVVLLVKAGQHFYGNEGIYVMSLISGLTDMDAIALSLSRMAGEGAELDPGLQRVCARGIILGAISNTFLKAVLAVWLGSAHLRKVILLVLGATILFGLVAWQLV